MGVSQPFYDGTGNGYTRPAAIQATGEEPDVENFYGETESTGDVILKYPEVRFEVGINYDREHDLVEPGDQTVMELAVQPFNGQRVLELDKEKLGEIPYGQLDELSSEVEKEIDRFYRCELGVPLPDHLTSDRLRLLETVESMLSRGEKR